MHCRYYSTISEAYRINSRHKSTCVVWTTITDVHNICSVGWLAKSDSLGVFNSYEVEPRLLHYHAVTCWSTIKMKSVHLTCSVILCLHMTSLYILHVAYCIVETNRPTRVLSLMFCPMFLLLPSLFFFIISSSDNSGFTYYFRTSSFKELKIIDYGDLK